MDWMSQDLAARLSARAAQGIGAGLLTARLGYQSDGGLSSTPPGSMAISRGWGISVAN